MTTTLVKNMKLLNRKYVNKIFQKLSQNFERVPIALLLALFVIKTQNNISSNL